VANLSTEGEACRNKADGVSNGRWRRALAKGVTRKHVVRGAAPYYARVWRIFLLLFFFAKSMTNPQPKQAERHAKIMGSGWAMVCCKTDGHNETDVVERRSVAKERSTVVKVKEGGMKLTIEHR